MDMEEENREAETSRVRVFVGGLGEGVTSDDLRRLFGPLGAVERVDIIRTKGRGLAYVDFIPSPTDQNSLSKLFSRYNGCLWKGEKLKLEKAKEHYLVRLKREWEEDAKIASDEPDTSPVPDESISSKEMPGKESLKTKKLRIFFPKLRKVKSIPFTGTGKHKYSFPKVEVPSLPVHFCDCEEHSSPSGIIRPKQFHNVEAESGGMNDEEINIMNVVMNKLFERENVSSPMHFEKEKNSNVSPGGLQSDESEADDATDDDDDGLIINMETKKKKTDIIGSLELERILRNQESELNEAKILKDEPNKNKLEVQKSNNIAPDKKRKPCDNFEGKRNDSTSATSEGKRPMHKHPDEMNSQVHSTELGGSFGEPTKVSWSQKSSWRELLGERGNSSFNASHMLLDSNSNENQGSDCFCEPDSAKDKTEHIVMEEDKEIEPAKAEVTEELAEARPIMQNATYKESGRGVAWKQKQSWTQLVGRSNNAFSISQIFPGISSQKPVAEEPAEDLDGSSDGNYIDLANESVGDDRLNLVKSSPEKKHNVLAKHTTVESVGDVLNMTRSTPEKIQHVAGNDIAPAPITEGKCDTHTNETSTTEVKIGETCSFMRSDASLKEWAKAKAALSGSLKRKRGEKKEH